MERRCSRCKLLKDENDFAGPFKSKPRKDVYCRSCRAAYQREHYLANRSELIRKGRSRKKVELQRRVSLLLDYLEQHPCVDCGESDPLVLEFDHLVGKAFTVADGMKSQSWAAILAELEKCEVVCVNCHRRRTAIRGGYRRFAISARGAQQGRLFGPWIHP